MTPVEPDTPALLALVRRIRESFVVYRPHDLDEAIKANAKFTVTYLLENSETIRKAVDSRKVEIFAAYYDMKDGAVRKLP